VKTRASSSVGREAVLILVAKAGSALATVVLAIVLANALGPASFGRYRLALTAAGIAALLAAQGLAAATGRFLVEAPDDPHRAAVLLRAGRAKAVLAILPAVALAALAVPIAHLLGKPEAWPLFLIAALSVPFTDVANWISGVFQATRQASASLAIAFAKSLVELPTAVILIAAGLGAVSGVIAYATANAVACGVGAYLLVTRWRRRGARGVTTAPSTAMMLKFGRAVWFTDLAFLGFQTVDQVMLQAFKGSRSVGLYDIAWQLTAGLTLLSTAVGQAVAPRLGDPNRRFANELFARSVGALTAMYAAFAVLTALVADHLVEALFESSFSSSGRILAALAPYVLLLGAAPLVSTGLNFLGIAHARRRIAIIALLINAVLDLVFIQWLGTIGPTIGTGIAFAYYTFAHCRLYRRTDIAVPWRSFGISCARGIAAGLAGAAVARACLYGFASPGVAIVLAAGILGAAIAAGILVAIGEWNMSLWRLMRERTA
jgi:O-antigen/teichoic acid export membrane protein